MRKNGSLPRFLMTALIALVLVPCALCLAEAPEVGENVFAAQTEAAGFYTLRLQYRAPEGGEQTMSLFINGRYAKTIPFAPPAEGADGVGETEAPIYLPAGNSEIRLRRMAGDGTVEVASFAVEPRAGATKLIIMPHEDDEVFGFGGIIQLLRQAGDDVRVALVTNGDYYNLPIGPVRIVESVRALEKIGLTQDNVFFLGYPNAGISWLLEAENPAEEQVFETGAPETYGNPDVGVYDYHTLQTGAPATMTRDNLVGDVEGLLMALMPTEIYTTAYYDEHYDHCGTYRLLEAALFSLKEKIGYAPLLHFTVIHSPYPNIAPWPERLVNDENGKTVYVPFTDPYFNQPEAPLDWENVTKVQLPLDVIERKRAAIAEYVTQMQTPDEIGYAYAFCKTDEFYWTKDFSWD